MKHSMVETNLVILGLNTGDYSFFYCGDDSLSLHSTTQLHPDFKYDSFQVLLPFKSRLDQNKEYILTVRTKDEREKSSYYL